MINKNDNLSLAKGDELTQETWDDFAKRLHYDCVGKGVDWHCTADALFTVQAKRLIFGIDLDYTDKKAICCDGSHWFSTLEYWDDLDEDGKSSLQEQVHKDFDECFTDLDEDAQWDILSELEDHYVTGYDETWEYVNSHFTKDAAEAFMRRKKHDYREGMRVYVESQYYAWEFNTIKQAILDGRLIYNDKAK